MNRELLLLLAVASVAWGSAVMPAAPISLQALPKGPQDFNCTGKDGYFADPYRQCKVFYRCLSDGSKWAFACPLDTEFSDQEKTCMPASQVNCPPVTVNSAGKVQTSLVKNRGGPLSFNCTDKDGYYADTYRNCQIFYRCLTDGTQFTYICPEGLLFSDAVHACLPGNEVQCVFDERDYY